MDWTELAGFCGHPNNPHVQRSAGNFLLAEELSASQEGLWFMELDRMLIVSVALMKGFANAHAI